MQTTGPAGILHRAEAGAAGRLRSARQPRPAITGPVAVVIAPGQRIETTGKSDTAAMQDRGLPLRAAAAAEAVTPETLVLSVGHQLRQQANRLAEGVVACEFQRFPGLRMRYGPVGGTRSREDTVLHIEYLADALDAHSPALFNDYIGWVKVLTQHRGVLGDDLAHHLECMAETLQQRMPAPVSGAAVEMIERALAALPAMPDTSASLVDSAERLSPLAARYLHSLLGGYRQAAGRLVFDAAARGEPVRELYLQVFQPALREVGRLWQMERVSVSQEHFCSAATQVVMAQLLPCAGAAARCGRSVVVACVRGDLHEVGARMVGDFFEMAGWDAYFCGADTPAADTVQSVVERRADVLAVSTTMGYHLHRTRELIDAVRAEPRCAGLRVLVGGLPFNIDPALWHTLGADGTASDAEAAVRLATTWMAGAGPRR